MAIKYTASKKTNNGIHPWPLKPSAMVTDLQKQCDLYQVKGRPSICHFKWHLIFLAELGFTQTKGRKTKIWFSFG